MNEYIRVTEDIDDDIIEIPIESDGVVLLSTLSAQYPGITGLKYKNENTGSWRGIRLEEARLWPPEPNNWGDRLYFGVFPKEYKKRHDSGGWFNVAEQLKAPSIHEDSKKCCDLIILGLPWSADENRLKDFFSKYGELVFAQIKRDGTGKSKGFGFIRFAEYDAQINCLGQKHNIDGRICEVRIPHSKSSTLPFGNSKIHVGRVTDDITSDDILSYFSKYGKVLEVFVPKPCRGFAFVTFADSDVAQRLIGEDLIIKNTSVRISSANAQPWENMGGNNPFYPSPNMGLSNNSNMTGVPSPHGSPYLYPGQGSSGGHHPSQPHLYSQPRHLHSHPHSNNVATPTIANHQQHHMTTPHKQQPPIGPSPGSNLQHQAHPHGNNGTNLATNAYLQQALLLQHQQALLLQQHHHQQQHQQQQSSSSSYTLSSHRNDDNNSSYPTNLKAEIGVNAGLRDNTADLSRVAGRIRPTPLDSAMSNINQSGGRATLLHPTSNTPRNNSFSFPPSSLTYSSNTLTPITYPFVTFSNNFLPNSLLTTGTDSTFNPALFQQLNYDFYNNGGGNNSILDFSGNPYNNNSFGMTSHDASSYFNNPAFLADPSFQNTASNFNFNQMNYNYNHDGNKYPNFMSSHFMFQQPSVDILSSHQTHPSFTKLDRRDPCSADTSASDNVETNGSQANNSTFTQYHNVSINNGDSNVAMDEIDSQNTNLDDGMQQLASMDPSLMGPILNTLTEMACSMSGTNHHNHNNNNHNMSQDQSMLAAQNFLGALVAAQHNMVVKMSGSQNNVKGPTNFKDLRLQTKQQLDIVASSNGEYRRDEETSDSNTDLRSPSLQFPPPRRARMDSARNSSSSHMHSLVDGSEEDKQQLLFKGIGMDEDGSSNTKNCYFDGEDSLSHAALTPQGLAPIPSSAWNDVISKSNYSSNSKPSTPRSHHILNPSERDDQDDADNIIQDAITRSISSANTLNHPSNGFSNESPLHSFEESAVGNTNDGRGEPSTNDFIWK